MKFYVRFLKYITKSWLQLAGVVICLVAVSFSNVAIIPIVSRLSEAIAAKEIRMINIITLLTLCLYFIKGVFMYGQVYLSALVSQQFTRDLRVELFKKIQDLSLDFFAKWRTGEIISRSGSDINTMQRATVASATELLPNILTLFGVIGYLFYLNWKLTLLSMVVLPLLFFTMGKFGAEMRRIHSAAQQKLADIASLLQENIAGIRVVKSFAMEHHEVKKYSKETERSFWISLRSAALHATQTPLLTFIQSLAIVGIVWYGSYEVVSGNLSPNNLIAFFAGVALLAEPLSKLSQLNLIVQRTIASAERVFEIIDLQPTVKEAPDAVKLEKLKGLVEFKNVVFKYDSGKDMVLKNINVKVDPGEIIALVGPSGAGKTTFVNLIARFYDPNEGAILVDGVDLKNAHLFTLRSQMGIVPQEMFLFSGTIRDNIAYGKTRATEDDILSSAKMANAHEFIMEFPDGYDTFVGERGVKLSGGQRQRIAIARALLRDPRILILDEATSSLDTESERLVQDALEKLMNGRTTFVIAHRLSTVLIADRILVLKNGEIVESGCHKELINKDGLYKKLYEMQFRGEEGF